MDSREQFEQWAKIVGPEPDLTRANGGLNYADSAIDIAWLAWKASRAAIEVDIDWPEANDDYWKDGEEGAYARGHEDGKDKVAFAVRKGLKEAGITVKGE